MQTYNAFIYLTALHAARILSEVMGDNSTLAAVDSAYALSSKGVVDDRLWNATSKFFRCHTKDGDEGDNQIFTDSLYGQMLSHHHFNGNFTVDTSYLTSHLDYEWCVSSDFL